MGGAEVGVAVGVGAGVGVGVAVGVGVGVATALDAGGEVFGWLAVVPQPARTRAAVMASPVISRFMFFLPFSGFARGSTTREGRSSQMRNPAPRVRMPKIT